MAGSSIEGSRGYYAQLSALPPPQIRQTASEGGGETKWWLRHQSTEYVRMRFEDVKADMESVGLEFDAGFMNLMDWDSMPEVAVSLDGPPSREPTVNVHWTIGSFDYGTSIPAWRLPRTVGDTISQHLRPDK
jgi:hypothetical protein